MKTIVYTISVLNRGGPTFVLYNLIKNLDRNRFSPIIVTLSDEKNLSFKSEFEKLDVPIFCIQTQGWRTFVFGVRKLYYLLKQIKPDIVHAQGFRDIVMVGLFLPKHYKTCATIHCDWMVDYRLLYGKLQGTISGWLERLALKRIDCRIACSKMLADILNNKYLSMHFEGVDNGVDTDKFHPVVDKTTIRRKLGLPTDKKIIIWAGSFIPRKDPLSFGQAVLQLPKNEYFVVLCGNIKAMAAQCQKLLTPAVPCLFTGHITNIEQYFQAADLYVSTSKSEGLPLAVLEAQFCGLVPLLSDIPQHRYILPKEQFNTCLYDNTVAGLVAKLQDCLQRDNTALLQACAVHIQHFSAKQMAQNYRKLYEHSLQK